ncbi:hypothetical protein COCNU_02G015380 [Cocos nucifera]|uniref:Uncharacterized protein n=1 Tax=Cocos nucifera TaxID=13894 RepID=A0A8K0I0K0_COCNU|nr:hypothetical protein COCNU_02G015380 [Cocos nucifera]
MPHRVDSSCLGLCHVDHDGTEMPSSFHPYLSTGYAEFSIKEAVRAYSIDLHIDYSGTSTVHHPVGYFVVPHVWNRQHQRRYDFSDHERTRDARLKKIGELYRGYKVKIYRGWLEHRQDTPEELVPWIQDCPLS